MPKQKQTVSKRLQHRPSVTATDFALAPPPMSGWLQKKNRHNMWQKRYFEISTHYLKYYKDERAGPGATPDGAVDIRAIRAFVPDSSVTDTRLLTLLMSDGERYELKAATAAERQKWALSLEERTRWVATHDKEQEEEEAEKARSKKRPTLASGFRAAGDRIARSLSIEGASADEPQAEGSAPAEEEDPHESERAAVEKQLPKRTSKLSAVIEKQQRSSQNPLHDSHLPHEPGQEEAGADDAQTPDPKPRRCCVIL